MIDVESHIQTDRIEIGKYFLEIIHINDLSIEGIARGCKMSKRVVYNIIQGKGYNFDSFLKLVYYLDIDLASLLKHVNIKQNLSNNYISFS